MTGPQRPHVREPGTSGTERRHSGGSLCPARALPSRSSVLPEAASSPSRRAPGLHLLCPQRTSGRQALSRTSFWRLSTAPPKSMSNDRPGEAPQTWLAPGCRAARSALAEEKASPPSALRLFALPSVQTRWQVPAHDPSHQPEANTADVQGSFTNSCADNQQWARRGAARQDVA